MGKWPPCLTIYTNKMKMNQNDLYLINQDLQRKLGEKTQKHRNQKQNVRKRDCRRQQTAKLLYREENKHRSQEKRWQKYLQAAAYASKEFQCMTAENAVSMRRPLAAALLSLPWTSDLVGMLSHTHPVSTGKLSSALQMTGYMHARTHNRIFKCESFNACYVCS